MAEDKQKNDDAADAAGDGKKGKQGLFLGGGIVGLIACAYALFLVAVPQAPGEMPLEGPFVVALSQSAPNVQANLKGDGGKRFVSMVVKAEYYAYDEAYATERTADPLYQAKERDAVLLLTRRKSREDLLEAVGVDVYKRELRDMLNPLLFPVHVGNATDPGGTHAQSGLAPGASIGGSTMRGGFHTHAVTLDAARGTAQLGQGPVVEFTGQEEDLQLENEFGRTVFVDVTGVKPDFVGTVPIGTFGRIEEILFDQFIIQ